MGEAAAGQGVLRIELDAIVANWRDLGARHGAPCAGVVKADGYGLGAVPVARALLAAGCRTFFVAHLTEGFVLRAGLGAGPEIIVLNGFPPGADEQAGLMPVLNSLGDVAAHAAAGRAEGRPRPALLHLDTGMSRLGLDAAEQAALAADRSRLTGLDLRFVMTHLACADEPAHPLNAAQAARFAEAAARIAPGVPRSFANSSGLFLGPAYRSDLARPGCALYGINPTPGVANPMRQVVTLEVPVLQIREIAAGTTVGYGAGYTAHGRLRVATVAAGYADGYLRSLSGRSLALFQGRAVPLIGRISMDLTTFDATEFPEMRPGDRLMLVGGPGNTPDDIAARCGTIGYEVLTALGPRYLRAHVGGA
ncbi:MULTISPECIES: alanine racemase [Roseomonadaceae]|uniref:Alanine racemase n=1 Tax=Falsiroseomonas oleicola TaxID=2801474 RepID=A0ABS6HFK2_9PROT|nr:alanine racemase [Roseomonas oleicola]MBU8546281.1 alanine racemase [Roseomonas oleicola]